MFSAFKIWFSKEKEQYGEDKKMIYPMATVLQIDRRK